MGGSGARRGDRRRPSMMVALLVAGALAVLGGCGRARSTPRVLEVEPADVELLLAAVAEHRGVPRASLPPVVPGSTKMARTADGSSYWAVLRFDVTVAPPRRGLDPTQPFPPEWTANTFVLRSVGEGCRWQVVSDLDLPISCPSDRQLPASIREAWRLETSCARPGRPCELPPKASPTDPQVVPACFPYVAPIDRGGAPAETAPSTCRDRPKS